ncbi:uncharacterized protein LOC132185872 [Corylus avellana]|uniref:uncharacterized protein LOC132185872 n=1 Tax=Corylus avellana TaxID=13451 RepID=UPI00286B4C55|nr:uncharacterized protein LOC132185872 [Corylus avellana]
MGSLMAGWQSPALDPKSAALKRNSSLTRGEIDAYWREKKKVEEEHFGAISEISDGVQESAFVDAGKRFERSNSAPSGNRKEDFKDMKTETSLEKIIKKSGWWTRSNSAFLNEPPLHEGASNTYTSQLHVASLGQSK